MFSRFAHYLSYGATDQQTARELAGTYQGLLVPGTVAAFQADGTKGFVLTLSASEARTPYLIDSRFPLFQQQLSSPKKSHESLAEYLGDPLLINRDKDPVPGDFPADRIDTIAKSWLDFNLGYKTLSGKHFAKYAERLGEEVLPENSMGPEWVLPPYLVCASADDKWWDVSKRLFDASMRYASARSASDKLVRVVGAQSAGALAGLLSDVEEDQAAIWVSGLDELDVTWTGIDALRSYGQAIRDASATGKQLFALYGGFFSVLLGLFGLNGSSHGIGYGEARDWIELPNSGPPPVRYYLPRAHRYISQDLALLFWREDRQLVECTCAECDGRSPASLDYQALMRHSVRCRHAEIQDWLPRAPDEVATRLEDDATAFETSIAQLAMPSKLRAQANRCHAHLRAWARIVNDLAP